MPLWLFNPAEPSASPTYRPGLGERGQTLCGGSKGLCACVPPFWKVIASSDSADPYIQRFMGQHILARDLVRFNDPLDATCQWGTDVYREDSTQTDVMVLGYFTVGDIGELLNTDWFVIFGNTREGADAGYIVDRTGGNAMWRCLSTNKMIRSPDSRVGAYPGFPATITAQPFWP